MPTDAKRWTIWIGVAVAAYLGIVVHDIFFIPDGELGIQTQWHGLPLPILFGLAAVLVAHLWVVGMVVNVVLGRWRLSRRERGLTGSLCGLLVVFHLLFWVDGRVWRRLVGLE